MTEDGKVKCEYCGKPRKAGILGYVEHNCPDAPQGLYPSKLTLEDIKKFFDDIDKRNHEQHKAQY